MKRLLLAIPLVCGFFLLPLGAGAEAPASYGWWSMSNSGPLTTPPPPGVPANGLYVASGLSGPTAIAALSFAVPSGSTAHRLILRVAGTPLVTAPPVACLATGPFQPAENGPWAKRPTYDCQAGQVTGQPDASRSSYGFDVGRFARNGSVAVVVLAGGKPDSIAFNQPDPDSLDVAQAPFGGAATQPAQAVVSAPAAVVAPPLSDVTPAVAAPAPAAATLAAPAGLPAVAPPAPAIAAAPRAAGSTGRSLPLRGTGGGGSAVPGRWAKSLALAALLGFLGAYTLGYGILGGRIGRVGLAVDDE